MLCLDDSTVCKPVVEREKQFYETLPESLKSFSPQYYGVIKVFLLQENDYISLAAASPSKYTPKSTSSLKRWTVINLGIISHIFINRKLLVSQKNFIFQISYKFKIFMIKYVFEN